MSFKNNLGGIRAWGRKRVLPVDRIKELLQTEIFGKYCVDKIIDFGAGTLYWSEWFQKIVGDKNIYSVDIIFKDAATEKALSPPPFRCFSTIHDVPYKQEGKGPIMFFTCDVLHHLSEEEWESIKQIVFCDCDFIVIKDIDCHYRFKNWMNRMHDRIINGEKIRNVDPEILMDDLKKHDYQCIIANIHKLWYSHFMLIAIKKIREYPLAGIIE